MMDPGVDDHFAQLADEQHCFYYVTFIAVYVLSS